MLFSGVSFILLVWQGCVYSGVTVRQLAATLQHDYSSAIAHFACYRYTVMRGNHLIKAMARYRMNSHDLNIERGRFSNIILVVSQYVIPCILWYDFNKLTILYIHVHISFISIHKSVMFFSVNKISVCLCVVPPFYCTSSSGANHRSCFLR